MAHTPRHVMNRGHNREAVFGDDEDGRYFLDLLARYLKPFPVQLLHYCSMTKHIHLLVRMEMPAALSKGMAGLLLASTFMESTSPCKLATSDCPPWPSMLFCFHNSLSVGLNRDFLSSAEAFKNKSPDMLPFGDILCRHRSRRKNALAVTTSWTAPSVLTPS